MKKIIFGALFLFSGCISAEESTFRRLVNSVDTRARPMRWVDEDVYMPEGLISDWPLPNGARSGECILLIASPREDVREARYRLVVEFGLEPILSGWTSGRYALAVFTVPEERMRVNIIITSVSGGNGFVDLSAFAVSQSACRRFWRNGQ